MLIRFLIPCKTAASPLQLRLTVWRKLSMQKRCQNASVAPLRLGWELTIRCFCTKIQSERLAPRVPNVREPVTITRGLARDESAILETSCPKTKGIVVQLAVCPSERDGWPQRRGQREGSGGDVQSSPPNLRNRRPGNNVAANREANRCNKPQVAHC